MKLKKNIVYMYQTMQQNQGFVGDDPWGGGVIKSIKQTFLELLNLCKKSKKSWEILKSGTPTDQSDYILVCQIQCCTEPEPESVEPMLFQDPESQPI